MKFGEFEIQSISGGRFRLDGGAMFGVVPKPLWERKSPADELNRIQLDTNCLCIQNGSETILCDTGFGTKLSSKELMHIEGETSTSIVDQLKQIGIERNDVTHVLFSHFHFDHVGGATILDSDNQLQLTFPNATHVFQKQELADATGNAPELEGNYYVDELKFLSQAATCQIVDGNAEILPGIHVEKTGGHTAGHQKIRIETEGKTGIYLGDICPTAAHLAVFWSMAYDAYQLDVRRIKFSVLKELAERKIVLFFDHDPRVQAATIRVKNAKSFEVDEVIPIRDAAE